MSLFNDYVDKITELYGDSVGQFFHQVNAAIIESDQCSNEFSLNKRKEDILSLVGKINASGGVPRHNLVVEVFSCHSVRISLINEHGLVWRNYVFESDVLFNLAQALVNCSRI